MIYAQKPLHNDRTKLIQEHLYLVDILVGRMVTQVPSFMNRDDMKSAGMMGLLDAANKYDPSQNTMFKTFAEHRIRGSILDEMRKLDWFSRSLRDKHNRISRTIADLEFKLGRDPEEQEIAKAMDLTLEQYQILLGEVSHLGCVSLNETLDHSDEGRSFLDSLVDTSNETIPSHRLESAELTKVIADALGQLSEKERLVIDAIVARPSGRAQSHLLIKLKNKVQTG